MDKQPEALRLAEKIVLPYINYTDLKGAAAELRRLHQSEQEGWRWAKECEAEIKRLRGLLAESGQGCSECGVTVSEGYALYCVKCVEPLFKKEQE